MKIRQGFVSNSSSSSFVLAIKKAVKCPHCGVAPLDVIDLVRRSNSDETCLKCTGSAEIIKYYKDNFIGADWVEWQSANKVLLDAIVDWEGKGFEVYAIQVSYDDDILNAAISQGEKSGHIKVLDRD